MNSNFTRRDAVRAALASMAGRGAPIFLTLDLLCFDHHETF